MLSDLQRVQLGAFLHDIGKFWQRTGEPHGPGFAEFKDDVGKHGAHARWSASFMEEHLPPDFRAAGYPALFHHQPNDRTSKLVAIGDRLSAAEREDSSGGPSPRQLVSPFCGISLNGATSRTSASYYSLSPLKIDADVIFPNSLLETGGRAEDEYSALWSHFVAEHKLLPGQNFDAYFHGLYYLLFKYGWCIPSAFYRDVPDISLFDHSRTTCAIATSLALQGVSESKADALLARDSGVWREPIFALIGGDLSGIQRFLYTLTAAGAARGLRGRSFYLQLLTDTVARWALSRLGLSISNLLYCGGGRFYILAHLEAREALPYLRGEISRKLLEAHGSGLYLALDALEMSPANLSLEVEDRSGDFGGMWWSIGERLNQAKRRKFAELGADEMHERIFSPRGSGGFARVCTVCRAEIHDRTGPESAKCSLCESFEELGLELRDARYLVATDEEAPEKGAPTWRSTLAAFGASYSIYRNERALGDALVNLEDATVWSLGNSDFLRPTTSGSDSSRNLFLGFTLHSSVAPRESDGTVADFNTMAERSRGIKRLGILRMDVDDLGEIFGRGLGKRSGPARLSSLSMMLRVFFESWVPQLCAGVNERGDVGLVYPIYSGGDDLLLVGSWSAIPGLAASIRRDFGRFVAGNPDVHLSAGMALEPKKFPLYQGAEHAREALDDRAKQRTVNGRLAKDAVDFLEQTLSWEEFARASSNAERLEQLIRSGKVPRALIHTIDAIHLQYETRAGQGKPKRIYFGRWMWLAAYSLTRMAERVWDRDAAREIRNIQSDLFDPVGITLAGLASRWAELLLREGD